MGCDKGTRLQEAKARQIIKINRTGVKGKIEEFTPCKYACEQKYKTMEKQTVEERRRDKKRKLEQKNKNDETKSQPCSSAAGEGETKRT